jgi:hypothetical protein
MAALEEQNFFALRNVLAPSLGPFTEIHPSYLIITATRDKQPVEMPLPPGRYTVEASTLNLAHGTYQSDRTAQTFEAEADKFSEVDLLMPETGGAVK